MTIQVFSTHENPRSGRCADVARGALSVFEVPCQRQENLALKAPNLAIFLVKSFLTQPLDTPPTSQWSIGLPVSICGFAPQVPQTLSSLCRNGLLSRVQGDGSPAKSNVAVPSVVHFSVGGPSLAPHPGGSPAVHQ